MSRYGVVKQENEYNQSLSREVYDGCPKAVFAAIAVSLATTGGDYLEEAQERIISEWWALYDNGIVKQKPMLKREASEEDEA